VRPDGDPRGAGASGQRGQVSLSPADQRSTLEVGIDAFRDDPSTSPTTDHRFSSVGSASVYG
jgi:hypothetical protein